MSEGAKPSIAAEWPLAVLMLASAFVVCFRLGSYSFVNGDEAVYHAIAEHMVASGDWFTLDFKGEHRVWDTIMNAPIQYWLRAAVITGFGNSLVSARILSALCGIGSIAMTYWMVRHVAERRTALLAGAIQLTTFQFVYLHSARTGELDTAIALLLGASAFLFVRAIETGRSFVPHHLCLVLMLNLKTPTVGIPILAELICFALLREQRLRFRDWLVCSLWVLPLGLAWHVSQLILLWDPIFEVVGRMGSKAAGSGGMLERLSGNAWYYAQTLLFGAFPYVLALPFALVANWRSDREGSWRQRVFAIFLLAVLLFYLPIAERNRWYVVPAHPFAAALIALWLVRLASARLDALAIAACAVVASGALWLDVGATTFNPFSEQANRIDMTTRVRDGSIQPLAAIATALVVAGGLFLARRRGQSSRFVAGAVAVVLLGIGATRTIAAFAHLGHQSEMAKIRQRIDHARATGEEVRLPIPVSEPLGGRASYYFADEFELVPVPNRSRLPRPIFFRLEAKRDGGH